MDRFVSETAASFPKASAKVGQASAQCHLLCDSAYLVGRTPRSARDALVPLLPMEIEIRVYAKKADGGVGRGPGGPPHRQSKRHWASACANLQRGALAPPLRSSQLRSYSRAL